ncbi:MAG: hypothetical protein ABIW82_12590 [Dokdonella sp.]
MNSSLHAREPNPAIVAALDAFESRLPQLMADFPDVGDLLDAFGNMADEISQRAAQDDGAYVDARIEVMLVKVGLHPDPHAD